MARLIDYAFRREFVAPDTQTIIADEVVLIMPERRYAFSEFPNVAPPFPDFLVEWKTPVNRKDYIGIYCRDMTTNGLPDERRPLEYKWALHLVLIQLEHKTDDVQYLNDAYCYLDDDGSIIQSPVVRYDSTLKLFSTVSLVLFFTLSLLHCKNVTLVENAPPEKLSKRAEKEHGIALHRFHTLNIRPMSSRGIGEYGGNSQSLKAAHIKRGHFKTFTDDAPLFGKWTGTYWWESHVAGSKAKGTVDKHYHVLPE